MEIKTQYSCYPPAYVTCRKAEKWPALQYDPKQLVVTKSFGQEKLEKKGESLAVTFEVL